MELYASYGPRGLRDLALPLGAKRCVDLRTLARAESLHGRLEQIQREQREGTKEQCRALSSGSCFVTVPLQTVLKLCQVIVILAYCAYSSSKLSHASIAAEARSQGREIESLKLRQDPSEALRPLEDEPTDIKPPCASLLFTFIFFYQSNWFGPLEVKGLMRHQAHEPGWRSRSRPCRATGGCFHLLRKHRVEVDIG